MPMDDQEISGRLVLLNRAKHKYDETHRIQDKQVYDANFDWFRLNRIGIHLEGRRFVLTAKPGEQGSANG